MATRGRGLGQEDVTTDREARVAALAVAMSAACANAAAEKPLAEAVALRLLHRLPWLLQLDKKLEGELDLWAGGVG